MKVCTPFPIATFPIANPALTRLYDILVDNRYRVEHKIGGGSGGDVYSGTWLLPSLPRPQIPISKGTDLELGEDVALKLEYIKKDLPVLEYESHVYESLAGGVGIPRMRWYGQECDFYVLISDLLGPSLEDLFNFCDRKFSLKTVLLLADQLIPRIEYLHSKSWVHRDIKPENFVMGTGKLGNVVHVIDFGLAQEYQQTETREHIPYCDRNHVGGTAIFASINNHLGVSQTRRDDLESLGYLMVYLCGNPLPWQFLQAPTDDESNELIKAKKLDIPIAELCRDLPEAFTKYFKHVLALKFEDRPNYSYLRRLFSDLLVREGFQYDHIFDWTTKLFSMMHDDPDPPTQTQKPKGGKTACPSSRKMPSTNGTRSPLGDQRTKRALKRHRRRSARKTKAQTPQPLAEDI